MRRTTDVAKAHDDDVACANTQNGAPGNSSQVRPVIRRSRLVNLENIGSVASPAGLSGLTPGSDLSADCVVPCMAWCVALITDCPNLVFGSMGHLGSRDILSFCYCSRVPLTSV